MGITVFYRGAIADLDRIEDMEDRVIDLALEIGGAVQIWRTASDTKPDRMVRGVIVELAPGQESTSLLISPEGWLTNLFEIEDAEEGRLTEPSWCFVKTQFGPVEGHVALIEMLDALNKEFIPNLEVNDEGGYWEHRDVSALRNKFAFLRAAISGLAEGLRQHGLTAEAAEDPEIVAARIERVAQQVQRTLARPPEHPPVRFASDEADPDGYSVGTEAEWDEMFKHNRRNQERMQRAIEERLHRGESMEDVFESALRDEGIIDLPGEEPSEEMAEFLAELEAEADEDEPWRESLPDAIRDDDDEFDDDLDVDDAFFDRAERSRHPLQKEATDLLMRLYDLSKVVEQPLGGHFSILNRGAHDMSGGLAQALGTRDFLDSGLCIVQLKRALRGAAFSRGALYPLRSEGVIDDATFEELHDTLKRLEAGMIDELTRLRDELNERQ